MGRGMHRWWSRSAPGSTPGALSLSCAPRATGRRCRVGRGGLMAAQQEAPPVEQDLSKRAIWAIFGGLMLAMLLAALDQTIVATALPTIVQDLGGAEHLSW